MAHWDGFQPTPPSGPSLRQWVGLTEGFTFSDDQGNTMESRWWEAGPSCGLSFEPINCTGARCEDFRCKICADPPAEGEEPAGPCDCNPEDCGDACAEDIPEAVHFYPFWIKKSYEVCELRDQNRVASRLASEIEQNAWTAVASKLWFSLSEHAESLGPTPVCGVEAVGKLLTARAEVGSGIMLTSAYAFARLTADGLGRVGPDGRQYINGIPTIVDAGFGFGGPPGAAPAGSAWIYHIDQLPIVAMREPIPVRVKNKPGCVTCCELHEYKRQAIVAFNTCRSYAALIQVAC
jgi:hypothetical protein